MGNRRQPDQAARLLSHAIVGVAAGAMVSKKAGAAGFVVAMLFSAIVHEALDAPVAELIADLGV